ncbi:hypothetical protein Salat_0637300 [Sesamum alatum]|uniref:Uncharacterized protein n=1 Tax=Sesamum alatum TaxID=300844 RepID=A0AAE1YQJ5_9LAMI|nr:hypothetical protein Salat_0637300 [Sesamum alatum]
MIEPTWHIAFQRRSSATRNLRFLFHTTPGRVTTQIKHRKAVSECQHRSSPRYKQPLSYAFGSRPEGWNKWHQDSSPRWKNPRFTKVDQRMAKLRSISFVQREQ